MYFKGSQIEVRRIELPYDEFYFTNIEYTFKNV